MGFWFTEMASDVAAWAGLGTLEVARTKRFCVMGHRNQQRFQHKNECTCKEIKRPNVRRGRFPEDNSTSSTNALIAAALRKKRKKTQ